MKPSRSPFWLTVPAALFFFACQPRVETLPPHMMRETVSPEYLLQSLFKRQEEIKSLKSFVQATVERDHFKQALRQTLVLRGNDAIRVDTFGLFGQALGAFVYKGGHALLYDPAGNRLYRDEEVWDAMGDLLGMVVDFQEIIGVFSGNIPHLREHRALHAFLEPEKKFYRLETHEPSGKVRFEIDLDAMDLTPVRWVKTETGRQTYSVSWSDYRPVEGRLFPHQMVIVNARRREKLTVGFQTPQINPAIAPDAFDLPFANKVPLSPPRASGRESALPDRPSWVSAVDGDRR